MSADASNEADREIVVSRIIEGPRRLVFDAFTSATHLAQWCAPTGGKIITHAFDFKPGGVWDSTTVTLVERGAATEVTLRMLYGTKEERDEKVAKYYAAQGARQTLDSLAAYVTSARASSN